MSKENLFQVWSTLSRKVLASVLIDNGAVFVVMEIIKHNAHWFSPKERFIYQAAVSCVETGTPPSVEAVSSRLNGILDAPYVQAVAGLFNDDDNRNLVYNTEQLREVGTLVKIKQIGKQLNEVETVDEVTKAIGRASTELTGVYADKTERAPTAQAVDEAAWEMAGRFTGQATPTGLNWFDRITGGLWPGMNYWIAAAYKSGKSTIMRNMVLAAAESGTPVSAYCAEGTREMFVLDCQAMLATRLLLAQGVSREQCRLSGLFLIRSWTKHHHNPVFNPLEYNAIKEARAQWQRLPVQVYDTRDGIRDLTTLQYGIKRDKLRFGVKAAFLDYSQLFGSGGTLFERQSQTALKIQEIGQNEDVAMIALAQKNETSIRDGGDNYSVGIKGGGDASAAADFLLVPSIDKDAGYIINITLKHSRHTQNATGAHIIVPASGLIVGDLE